MELKTKYNIGYDVYFVMYSDEEYYDKENDDYYLEEKPYDVCKGKIVHICMNYKNEIDSYKLYVQEYGTYNWADNVYSTKEEAMIEFEKEKENDA